MGVVHRLILDGFEALIKMGYFGKRGDTLLPFLFVININLKIRPLVDAGEVIKSILLQLFQTVFFELQHFFALVVILYGFELSLVFTVSRRPDNERFIVASNLLAPFVMVSEL